MAHNDLMELAASARARKTARFFEAHKVEIGEIVERETAPLKQRVTELEGLLDEAVKRGDGLAADLEKSAAALAESKAHVESLQSQLKSFEAQTAKAAPAKKKGK